MKDYNSQPVTDAMIQRLIDGMLDHAEYREVLKRLERSSDGWRRCSLAFLEDQALQQELDDIDFSAIDFASVEENAADSDASPVENPCEHDKTLWESLVGFEHAADNGELSGEYKLGANSLPTAKTAATELAGKKHRDQSGGTRRFGKRLWPKLLVGTAAGIMCLALSVHLMSPSVVDQAGNSNTLPNQFRNVDNSRVLSIPQVPIAGQDLVERSDPVADLEFVDSMIWPSHYGVENVSDEIQTQSDDTHRYETQIRRFRLSPMKYDRWQ